MCGIIGVFNQEKAFEQVIAALALLRNRGKDGFGVSDGNTVLHENELSEFSRINNNCIIGHALHAVVNHIPQPLKSQGILATNCEIYNWKELNEKYHFKAENDAEFLARFLDKFGVEKLGELDGVYAFGYWNGGEVILARDILGEKPLWYSGDNNNLSFASERKVLQELGYKVIQELHPRQILTYSIKNKKIKIQSRKFFIYVPEHKESYSVIKEKIIIILDKAIQKRVPEQKFGLLFSGGVDSTYLAHYFKSKGYNFSCYTTVLDSETIAPDLEAAQKVAQKLGLKLKVRKIKLNEIPTCLQEVVPLIEDSNVVKVGVALTLYAACELAKEDGCKVIFSGLGSEELFAGYERHKNSSNINQECLSGLRKMFERDLYRDDVITMANNLELRLPFLDIELVKYALKIPEKYKIKDGIGKFILREITREEGIPDEIAFRKKTAAQYGSRIDSAFGKLAKQNGFPSKSAYLKKFYPYPNLKLGVLFSGGKDSTYAAYIVQRQNYELTCLITLKSENPDSYMFHTPTIEMVELQAKAMGLPIIVQKTKGEKERELVDLEKALQMAKEQYHIEGIVTGAVFSTYQRDRIEAICDTVGLKIFSPLWHKNQEQELRELIENKFTFVMSSIAAEGLDEEWLNQIVTEKEITKLTSMNHGFNFAGEGGEFESLVLDCPLFRKKIEIIQAEKVMEKEHTGRLIIKEAKLIQK